MGASSGLAERIRLALAAEPSVREVKMFGGLAFMVNDAMVVCVRGDGDLLVRADPDRSAELLARPGAHQAEMGTRSMGPSWISVDQEALADDEDLGSWITVALEHNARQAATPPRRRKATRSS